MSDHSKLLDGKAVAQRVLDATAQRVRKIVAAGGPTPCLAAVLVGGDPASVTYVKMKAKRCEAVGMRSRIVELPESTGTGELVARLGELGRDPEINGILLQHPVPRQIDERAAFEAIPAGKDVDGVTVASFGAMAFNLPGFGSCTPAGIMRLLREYEVKIAGAHAVVIGRSAILGKPMAMMLLAADATVTICHSKTANLAEVARQADILVAAVGKARFVPGDWIKPGAVVIDAGYTGSAGDVDFDAALPRARLITPVPGGVGPMTIALLLEQTVLAAERQWGVAQA